jgi:hypothetical protein
MHAKNAVGPIRRKTREKAGEGLSEVDVRTGTYHHEEGVWKSLCEPCEPPQRGDNVRYP